MNTKASQARQPAQKAAYLGISCPNDFTISIKWDTAHWTIRLSTAALQCSQTTWRRTIQWITTCNIQKLLGISKKSACYGVSFIIHKVRENTMVKGARLRVWDSVQNPNAMMRRSMSHDAPWKVGIKEARKEGWKKERKEGRRKEGT